ELGTDMNGSLRVPAHCCGVFAHKPTHALVPMRGCAPPGTPQLPIGFDVDLAVAGPMARTAADLLTVLDAIAGPDDYQAKAYTVKLPPPRRTRLKDFRALLLLEHPLLPLADEVRACVEEFGRNLERIGCQVRRTSPALPALGEVARHYGQLLMAFI